MDPPPRYYFGVKPHTKVSTEFVIKSLLKLFSGTYFDIKEFHSIVLSNGAMPLSVLEVLVKEWINDVKEREDDVDKKCLSQIVDAFWEWRMKNNPEFASNIGDHRYTDKVEDFSLEAFEMRKVKTFSNTSCMKLTNMVIGQFS